MMTHPLHPCRLGAASRSLKLTWALGFMLALTGCATIDKVQPGTPVAQVESQFGRPTLICPLPNGGQRMIWSQQPSGQYVWATNVNAQGLTGPMTQMLDDKLFEQLKEGVWTPERVQCEFGPPADISKVGLPSDLKVVWSYRYRQYNTWYMMMYVFFGPDGKHVINHYPGPDPWYLYDGSMLWR